MSGEKDEESSWSSGICECLLLSQKRVFEVHDSHEHVPEETCAAAAFGPTRLLRRMTWPY
jgi:hypothetical protein